MNNTFIFLRHAETHRDKNIPVSEWKLSALGKQQADKLASFEVFNDIDVLIASKEVKSSQTLEPLSKKIVKKIQQLDGLQESERDDALVMSKQIYDDMKIKTLKDLDYTNYGWETSNEALMRFKKAVAKIDSMYDKKKILISSHGTILSLYFADLLDDLTHVLERWKKLDFCKWGVVEDNKVIKDIIAS